MDIINVSGLSTASLDTYRLYMLHDRQISGQNITSAQIICVGGREGWGSDNSKR